MTLYYKEALKVHENHPTTPQHYQYLDKEHQWLLTDINNVKRAFFRYSFVCYILKYIYA